MEQQATQMPNPSGFRVRTFKVGQDDELVTQLLTRLALGIRADFNFTYEHPVYQFVYPVQFARAFDNAVMQIRRAL